TPPCDTGVGQHPDLSPFFASPQTRTGGANVSGLQDPLLDGLLETAHEPATDASRKSSLVPHQPRVDGGTYARPIAWPDSVVAVRDRVVGPAKRVIADGSE